MNQEHLSRSFHVTISVGGRFHAFDLARQLQKRGLLKRLITSYPVFEARNYGIRARKTRSILVKELIQRFLQSVPIDLDGVLASDYLLCNLFDRIASQYVGGEDLFVGWAGFSLFTMQRVQSSGGTVILERGSSHIQYQRNILQEEYRRFDLEPDLPSTDIVRKELREYRECDYISVPSSYAQRTFVNKGIPEEKLIRVPYGVNLQEFKNVPKKDDVFRVVYAGGMSIRKGVPYLLEVFSELELDEAQLILLGAKLPEIKPFFQRYDVRSGTFEHVLNGDPSIVHLGHQPEDELYKYYSQSSVYCQLSIEDGFGMVISQAMACGLPVIATENTGGKDMVDDGESGYIIPIRAVDELKEKLLQLYDQRDRCERMGKAAREKVTSGYSWDDYGRNISEAYERVLR